MEWIELQVSALSNSESAPGHFVLVLEEAKSRRRLPVIIGAFEAQAIAIFMERLQPPRPLTHDLFAQTLVTLGAAVERIEIYAIIDGAFAARIKLKDAHGKQYQQDARTSDAVALAVRMNAPVLVTSEIFEQYAISEETRKGIMRGSLLEYGLEELDLILADLLEKEDYESAAKVRDVIRKKQNKQDT
jgi:bifunctional DNase/RNase